LGENFDQANHFAAAELEHAGGKLQIFDKVADALRREVRRGGEQQGLHEHRQLFEMLFVPWKGFRIALGELGDLIKRLALILPHEKMAAIGKRREERGILGVDDVAEAVQLQLAHDALLQQAGQVRGSGNAEAGPDFLGNRAAAYQFAALQHQDLAAGASQISGRYQAVVAGTDDDDIKTI